MMRRAMEEKYEKGIRSAGKNGYNYKSLKATRKGNIWTKAWRRSESKLSQYQRELSSKTEETAHAKWDYMWENICE